METETKAAVVEEKAEHNEHKMKLRREMVANFDTHLDLDFIIFSSLDNRRFRFINMSEGSKKLLVWEILPSQNEWKQEICTGLDIHLVSMENLKRINIWDKLPVETQKEIESKIQQKKDELTSRFGNSRGRPKKYINVPRELVCTKCGDKINIVPGTLVKRVEKICETRHILMNVDDYAKQYKCKKCEPLKGNFNPLYNDIPKETTCSCGRKMVVNRKLVLEKSEKKKMTIAQIIKEMKCRKCVPLKGRQANPELAHLPRELVCKCGAKIKTTPSYIMTRAKDKGISPDEFVKNYRCQRCFPSKGRSKIQKYTH